MREVKVNFLETPLKEKPKTGLFFFGRAFGTIVAVGAIAASFISFYVASNTSPETNILDTIPVISQLRGFLGVGAHAMKADDGRTNLLILGVGGPGHDGPQLSDTMLFVSLDRPGKRVGVISIPRDLVVNIPDQGERKINSANAYGEEKGFGEGPKLTRSIMEDVLGQKIHYYVRVDFQAFVKIIDDVGGIDVNVDRAFTDSQFPTKDGGLEAITFARGAQHMDGTTSLRFARSRHGTNGEGSDFARSARQQKIISTLREKLLSKSTLFSPSTINAVLRDLKSHVTTNLTSVEIMSLAREFRSVQTNAATNQVLSPGPESPLYETFSNGAYVILPKAGDWSDLHALADKIFDPTSPSAIAIQTEIRVEVQNGTDVTGLARRVSGLIAKNGFTVARITNAAERNHEGNVIYDLSRGGKPKEFAKLKKLLNAKERVPENDWIFAADIAPTDGATPVKPGATTTLDFLVIVGEEPLAFR